MATTAGEAPSEEEAAAFQLRHAWHLRTQTPIEALAAPDAADESECRFRIWLVKNTINAPSLGLSFTDAQIRAALEASGWDYVSATMNLLLH